MRASTIFALTLSLLIGLAAVVGARYAGWLGKAELPRREVQVLVAARNLFPGDVIDTTWVKARTLRPEELPHYDNNKQQYLPAVPSAAAMRVASRPIEADVPILRNDLAEMAKPAPLHERLLPSMRAVNLSLQKDQSAGGLIQVGEWVDVFLTTTISSDSGAEVTRTSPIAQNVRVIAKRNALWNIFAGLPDNKPVHFTLEANPYRAGLIEFCKTKGTLSMAPLSAAEQRVLEDKRARVLAAPAGAAVPVAFTEGKGDTAGEEGRVDALNRGEYSIGTADLVRIFDLSTPPPPRPDTVVEQWGGLARTRLTRFNADGAVVAVDDLRRGRAVSIATADTSAERRKASGTGSFRFNSPDCKTAGKKG